MSWGCDWYSSSPSITHTSTSAGLGVLPGTETLHPWEFLTPDYHALLRLWALLLNKIVQVIPQRCLSGWPWCQIYYSLFSSYISSTNYSWKGIVITMCTNHSVSGSLLLGGLSFCSQGHWSLKTSSDPKAKQGIMTLLVYLPLSLLIIHPW